MGNRALGSPLQGWSGHVELQGCGQVAQSPSAVAVLRRAVLPSRCLLFPVEEDGVNEKPKGR